MNFRPPPPSFSCPAAMDYLGDKLTVAQTQMTHWVGSVRRSLQEALNLVTTAVTHERTSGEGASRAPFKRTSSFRHFASRSRESFRRFSVRSQQRLSSLRKRQASSEQPDLVSIFLPACRRAGMAHVGLASLGLSGRVVLLVWLCECLGAASCKEEINLLELRDFYCLL